MSRLRALLRGEGGATAAEFALVLPVALLFLLGIIDVGRYAWALNRMEKAVQMGARYAVATSIVPSGLNAMNYVGFNCGTSTLSAGDTICRDALGTVSCKSAGGAVSCACVPSALSGSCPTDLTTVNSTAFANIVARIHAIAPMVGAANVTVKYSGSGIGYAGDPNQDAKGNPLSQISPVVTVQLSNLTLPAVSLLGAGIRLPSFQYSQTLEDGDGAIAY